MVALSQVQTGQGIPLVLKDVSLPPPYTDSLPDYQVSSDQGLPWYSRMFTSSPHTWTAYQTIR